MHKKIKLILLAAVATLWALIAGACDPSLYDADPNMISKNQFKDLLDPHTAYTQLLDDLYFMKSSCYFEEKLAAAQGFSILMSYGVADVSVPSSTLTPLQFDTKSNLYMQIKMISTYTGGLVANDYIVFSPNTVLFYTDLAITYCNQMLLFFPADE